MRPNDTSRAAHALQLRLYREAGPERREVLWLKLSHASAFVYNIAVEEDQRRKGYGRAIMAAGERWSRDHGAATIGLHVFSHNHGARALYEQLGYVETGRRLAKQL